LEIEEYGGENHERHDVHGERHAIDRVARDSAEDAPRLVDGVVDHGKPRRRENECRRAACGVGGAGPRGAAIRLLQGGGVVHAVAGHRHDMPALLQGLDDGVFVLGEDPREAVGRLDGVCDRGRHVVRVHVRRKGLGRRDDVGAEAELARDFAGDGGIVPGHHLDAHALGFGALDGGAGIVARWIEHRQDAEQRPALAAIAGAGDGERPVSPAGEVGDGLFDHAGDVGGGLRERDDRLRRSLRHRERRSLRAYDRRLGPLRYRIERNKIGTAVGVERMGVLERSDDRVVDGVAVAGLGGQRRGEDDVLRILRR